MAGWQLRISLNVWLAAMPRPARESRPVLRIIYPVCGAVQVFPIPAGVISFQMHYKGLLCILKWVKHEFKMGLKPLEPLKTYGAVQRPPWPTEIVKTFEGTIRNPFKSSQSR